MEPGGSRGDAVAGRVARWPQDASPRARLLWQLYILSWVALCVAADLLWRGGYRVTTVLWLASGTWLSRLWVAHAPWNRRRQQQQQRTQLAEQIPEDRHFPTPWWTRTMSRWWALTFLLFPAAFVDMTLLIGQAHRSLVPTVVSIAFLPIPYLSLGLLRGAEERARTTWITQHRPQEES